MINSIDEVQQMCLLKASLENDPLFKRSYMMLSPGSPTEKLQDLMQMLPQIPESYTDIIKLYSINGLEIAGFNVSPYFNTNPDVVEDLIEAYEDPFFPKEFMQKHKMYQIGSWNTDILCITEGTDQFGEGEILYVEEGYDIYNPEDSQIHPLAKDFEQFLIVAGNIEQLHEEMQGEDSLYPVKEQEFLDCLARLEVDKKYYPAWLNVF
ncbi:hypothetical protein [Candidatus Odyssella thessalonicensis]|uniref:hypothetical protein n=1 Tax=Candidatus Odyssella thessalonicensis TaxID=84647 RepID=UPI000225BFB1|nr:hypothetical protein [Candidatus Odyssella thessalonicensis]